MGDDLNFTASTFFLHRHLSHHRKGDINNIRKKEMISFRRNRHSIFLPPIALKKFTNPEPDKVEMEALIWTERFTGDQFNYCKYY